MPTMERTTSREAPVSAPTRLRRAVTSVKNLADLSPLNAIEVGHVHDGIDADERGSDLRLVVEVDSGRSAEHDWLVSDRLRDIDDVPAHGSRAPGHCDPHGLPLCAVRSRPWSRTNDSHPSEPGIGRSMDGLDRFKSRCNRQSRAGPGGDTFEMSASSRSAATFEELVAEASAAPVNGWDFSWLSGRAAEERPWWGYSRLAAQEVSRVRTLLDIQTGGGEVLAEILMRAFPLPALVAATESWPPNVGVARSNLARFGVSVEEVMEQAVLPFDEETFDLVLSRHPIEVRWDEVARVLMPGGVYLAQHVGPGSNRELTDFLMGGQPVSDRRSPERVAEGAQAAGLSVLDLRDSTLRVEFFDVGAVVYFLRMVVWTVPDFSVENYGDRLLDLHRYIQREGCFVSHAKRFLVEAVKSGDT